MISKCVSHKAGILFVVDQVLEWTGLEVVVPARLVGEDPEDDRGMVPMGGDPPACV